MPFLLARPITSTALAIHRTTKPDSTEVIMQIKIHMQETWHIRYIPPLGLIVVMIR